MLLVLSCLRCGVWLLIMSIMWVSSCSWWLMLFCCLLVMILLFWLIGRWYYFEVYWWMSCWFSWCSCFWLRLCGRMRVFELLVNGDFMGLLSGMMICLVL